MTDTFVRSTVQVRADAARAFEVFTKGLDSWWTRDHHVLQGTLKEIGCDPYVGGRMWEENAAGETCTWGRVLTWEPPSVFVFSWLIGPDFGVPGPDAQGSRVTVTFTPNDAGTLVELVHDQLDVHGPGWEGLAAGVGSDGGWPLGMRTFAAEVERVPA